MKDLTRKPLKAKAVKFEFKKGKTGIESLPGTEDGIAKDGIVIPKSKAEYAAANKVVSKYGIGLQPYNLRPYVNGPDGKRNFITRSDQYILTTETGKLVVSESEIEEEFNENKTSSDSKSDSKDEDKK